jgi:hypothetical protein
MGRYAEPGIKRNTWKTTETAMAEPASIVEKIEMYTWERGGHFSNIYKYQYKIDMNSMFSLNSSQFRYFLIIYHVNVAVIKSSQLINLQMFSSLD